MHKQKTTGSDKQKPLADVFLSDPTEEKTRNG